MHKNQRTPSGLRRCLLAWPAVRPIRPTLPGSHGRAAGLGRGGAGRRAWLKPGGRKRTLPRMRSQACRSAGLCRRCPGHDRDGRDGRQRLVHGSAGRGSGPDGTVYAENPRWLLEAMNGAPDKALTKRLEDDACQRATQGRRAG